MKPSKKKSLSLMHLLKIKKTQQKDSIRPYYFQITDNSMEAKRGITFPLHTYIGVDPWRKPQHRDFVIAQASPLKEAIFRQLVIKNKQKLLHPLNPDYPDMPMGKEGMIHGVVCQCLKVIK